MASKGDTTLYRYKAVVERVSDGDTVCLTVQVGFYITVELRCRLHAINVFESDEPGGPEAARFLAELLPAGTKVVVRSVSADRYSGRFVGQIFLPDGRDVSDVMVAAGYAAPWNGRGEKPKPVWPIPAVDPKEVA
jgi:endonuclease YncB( thermonuclease family)